MDGPLPVEAVRQDVLEALDAGPFTVLDAPTGSGKSTQVPQWLYRHLEGSILVLEPRRVAARLLARRVAEEMGCPLGGEVGYQVRFDRKAGPSTRVLFVTDGILLRRLIHDPELKGVDAVVFDEFHERHLESDLVLSLLREQALQGRSSRRLIVMSATLDGQNLVEKLEGARMLQAEGRRFPVEIRYLEKTLHPAKTPVWEAAALACRQAMREQADGHVLMFMPGRREIRRTLEALRSKDLHKILDLRELHGGLPLQQQAAALRHDQGRACIVATNIAESSLTVDGVTCVIDSGLERRARFDPWKRMETLLVEPVSRASADQRTGRAGRTAPGLCYRLWTESSHGLREAHTPAEIHRCDLAPAFLQSVCAVDRSVKDIPWLEPPDEVRSRQAYQLLEQLGALGEDGRPTRLGRDLADLPLHPRDARFLRSADQEGLLVPAAEWAALRQAGSLLKPTRTWEVKRQRELKLEAESNADPLQELAAFELMQSQGPEGAAVRSLNLDPRVFHQALKIRNQLLRLFSDTQDARALTEQDRTILRRLAFIAYSDQLARRVGSTRRYHLSGGREAELDEHSTVRGAPWLVALDMVEIGTTEGATRIRITSASRVEPEWMEEDMGAAIRERSESFYESGTRRVMRKEARCLGDLEIESQQREETDPDRAARILVETWKEGAFSLHAWNEEVERWMRRCNLAASLFPEYNMSPYDEDARVAIMEQFVYGAFRVKELQKRPLMNAVKSWLSSEEQGLVEQMLPDRLKLSSGHNTRVCYPDDGEPYIAAFIQDFFGCRKTPTLADGRLPLKIHLLAPNRRAEQITQDLDRFWSEHYPDIRNRLSKRYPKHKWPEQPV